jgi:hypothetical protein
MAYRAMWCAFCSMLCAWHLNPACADTPPPPPPLPASSPRHLVVTNPHIQRVYMSYFHAFETLRVYPPVTSLADNNDFCALLRRLVDEHGRCAHVSVWGGGGLGEVVTQRTHGVASC